MGVSGIFNGDDDLLEPASSDSRSGVRLRLLWLRRGEGASLPDGHDDEHERGRGADGKGREPQAERRDQHQQAEPDEMR